MQPRALMAANLELAAARIRRADAKANARRRNAYQANASAGAIISPADYLDRLTQINTYLRALDRDISRAYASRAVTDHAFHSEWQQWFGDWTEFYATHNSWIDGLTGGALQQAEELNTRGQDWRRRFVELAGVAAVTTPGEGPTLGGPADRAQGLDLGDTLKTVAIVGAIAVVAVIVLPRALS